jgi:streptogramin lyase
MSRKGIDMIKRLALATAAALVLTGCGGHQGLNVVPTHSSDQNALPQVLQSGKTPVNWTQFKWGGASGPSNQGIVAGPDGNMWYTDYSDSDLIKMTMSGSTHIFALPANLGPTGIGVGSDGKFYIGLYAQPKIGVATTSGAFSTIPIPSGDSAYNGNPVLGPDGNIWFAELAHIARVTPSGTITEYPYPNGETSNSNGAVAAGPNGDVWVNDSGSDVVDDVDPQTGDIVAYRVPCSPQGIAAASDGNLWLDCNTALVRLSPGGSTTSYFAPYMSQYPTAFTVGPDGNPWFAFNVGNAIGEFNVGSTTMSVYYPPTNYTNDFGLASGPDGNVWAVDSSGKIDVYIIRTISVAPKNLTFTTLGSMQTITVTEKSASAWTATSSKPTVATVAQGTPANTFVVTSVAIGKCTITVSDAIGNSAAASVNVTGRSVASTTPVIP